MFILVNYTINEKTYYLKLQNIDKIGMTVAFSIEMLN